MASFYPAELHHCRIPTLVVPVADRVNGYVDANELRYHAVSLNGEYSYTALVKAD